MRGVLIGVSRFLFVSVGIIAFTSLSIDATQFFHGSQSALGIFAQNATGADCPSEMVRVELLINTYICIDRYEVSPSSDCSISNPKSVQETANNFVDESCVPVSVKGALPWTNIARPQSEQACARVGKRLPTHSEWYAAALGTPDNKEDCNIVTENAVTAGANEQCKSGGGAYDLVGNVWEWVSGEVVEGQFAGTALPPDGYVASISQQGLPTETTSTPQTIFNYDYFWSVPGGSRVMMRGGFYGSQSDAGVYSVHASAEQTFSSGAVGFRCAVTLE